MSRLNRSLSVCALAVACALAFGAVPVHAGEDGRDGDHGAGQQADQESVRHRNGEPQLDAAEYGDESGADLPEPGGPVYQQSGERYGWHQRSGLVCDELSGRHDRSPSVGAQLRLGGSGPGSAVAGNGHRPLQRGLHGEHQQPYRSASERVSHEAPPHLAVVSGRHQRGSDHERAAASRCVDGPDLQRQRQLHAARGQRVQLHDAVQLRRQAQSADLLPGYEPRLPRAADEVVPTAAAAAARSAVGRCGGLHLDHAGPVQRPAQQTLHSDTGLSARRIRERSHRATTSWRASSR